MSHYTCIVIGPNPEGQLAPYHEFECTGNNDAYVQDIDRDLDEIHADYEKHGEDFDSLRQFIVEWYGGANLEAGDVPDLSDAHKFGYHVFDGDKLIRSVDRTNPNAKWDWYVLGGRWPGFFLHENGTQVDQLFRRQLDIDGMRDAEEKKLRDLWEQYECAMDAAGNPPIPRPWREIYEGLKDDTDKIQKAREERAKDPWLQALGNDIRKRFFLKDSAEFFAKGLNQLVKEARANALSPYAIVKDSQWYAKGEMGWWGISTGETTQEEWNDKASTLIETLPPDTLLSMYDLHI